MPDALTIRDFRPRDLPAVIALNMRATNPGVFEQPDVPLLATLRHYPDLLHVPSAFQRAGAFLVGTVDGALAAMGAARPAEEPGAWSVHYLRVANAHQRRGYARRLMAALEARAVARGARALVLDTTERQVPAQRLYASLGFVETGRGTVRGGDGRRFALVYFRKEVTPASASDGRNAADR